MKRESTEEPVATVQTARLRLDITSSETISFRERVPATLARLGLSQEPQEVFWAICYDAEMKVRTIIEIARGTFTNVAVHYPALYAAILASGCDRFAVAHNHPSDNPAATPNDHKLTKDLMDQANLLGLYFENHYIVTPSGKSTDFAAKGYLIPTPYHTEGLAEAADNRKEIE